MVVYSASDYEGKCIAQELYWSKVGEAILVFRDTPYGVPKFLCKVSKFKHIPCVARDLRISQTPEAVSVSELDVGDVKGMFVFWMKEAEKFWTELETHTWMKTLSSGFSEPCKAKTPESNIEGEMRVIGEHLHTYAGRIKAIYNKDTALVVLAGVAATTPGWRKNLQ